MIFESMPPANYYALPKDTRELEDGGVEELCGDPPCPLFRYSLRNS